MFFSIKTKMAIHNPDYRQVLLDAHTSLLFAVGPTTPTHYMILNVVKYFKCY